VLPERADDRRDQVRLDLVDLDPLDEHAVVGEVVADPVVELVGEEAREGRPDGGAVQPTALRGLHSPDYTTRARMV